MDNKIKIINLLENAKKDYQSLLNNKSTTQDFKPCEFGFCWYFKRKGFRYDYEGFNKIIAELEKDKIGEKYDENHWYPTIFYDGYSSHNDLDLFQLRRYQIKTNNEILQTQIDHLNRTIKRLEDAN